MEEKYLAFALALNEICRPRSVPVTIDFFILISEDLEHLQVFIVHDQVFMAFSLGWNAEI